MEIDRLVLLAPHACYLSRSTPRIGAFPARHILGSGSSTRVSAMLKPAAETLNSISEVS